MKLFANLGFLVMGVSTMLMMGGCISDQIFAEGEGPCDFPADLSAYTMVWNDEFDSEIDPNTWTFELGDGCQNGPDLCGWGNNEKQWYTNESKNARVENGNLVITAVQESSPVSGYLFTSARMITKGKADFKYGRFDIRAKLPKGQGLWPAIWMLPTDTVFGKWPASGEIDIMELLGHKPREILGTAHFGDDLSKWKFKSSYFELEGEDFSQDFHTFSLLWKEDCFRFMVDGQLYGNPITPSTTLPNRYPFNETFHIILNVAVGGNLPGDPDASTVFPQKMEVDYVRVYEEN